MERNVTLDYPTLTKAGFLIGLTLFLGGAIGGALLGGDHSWVSTALLDMEAIGLVVGFFSPFVFGIFLPLIE